MSKLAVVYSRPQEEPETFRFTPDRLPPWAMNALLRRPGEWQQLSPGLFARLNGGSVEMHRLDGQPPNSFLLR